jgi:hypothetical protein
MIILFFAHMLVNSRLDLVVKLAAAVRIIFNLWDNAQINLIVPSIISKQGSQMKTIEYFC